MRNQLIAGFFYCLTAQATLFTVWANYHEGSLNPFSVLSTLAMWFSCYYLVRALTNREYREQYQAIWNPWAIAGHPEAVVRFGYGLLERPKLMIGGGCVAWFSKRHQTMCFIVVRPRFFLFTHHLVQDSQITTLLFEGHRDHEPSRRLRWYSWLLRAEYVEYTQNVYAGLDYVTIRDVRRHTCWEDPHATNYYQRVASAMLTHWSAIPYLGYKPELPECLQQQ